MYLKTQKRLNPGFVASIFLMLALLGSCGKEAPKKSEGLPPQQDQVRPGEMEAQLARQSVSCDNGVSCPPGIVKISIVDQARLKTCTGFLVNATTVATAASCLTDRLRISMSDRLCQTDVHIFFAQSDFQSAKRVGCAGFLLVTPLEGNDPVLWGRDLAYITLSEAMPRRRRMTLSRGGITDGEQVYLWKVDQENDQVGIIRRSTCEGVLSSYANPLSTRQFDANYLISDCQLRTGNRGAPVLNRRGDWIGVFTAPLSSTLMTSIRNLNLLSDGIKSLGHVSSTVCLPALRDDDPVTRAECFRDLTVAELDRARDNLLNNTQAHETARATFAQEASALRPYLNWDAELLNTGSAPGQFSVRLRPKCFKPISQWIRQFREPTGRFTYRMTVPDWRINIAMDSAARVVSRVTEAGTKIVNVEFSLSQARTNRSSYVRVWSGSVDNRYEAIGEACE